MYPTDGLTGAQYFARMLSGLLPRPDLGVARRHPEDDRRAWPWGPWGLPLSHSRSKLSRSRNPCMCESGVGGVLVRCSPRPKGGSARCCRYD
jgi:hypothetical protein